MLLTSSDEAFAWVRWVVLAAGVVVGAIMAGGLRRVGVAAVAAAVLVGLTAPGAYAVTTAATAHSGSIPAVGTSASAMGGGTAESTSAQIAAWVAANYPATTVGGQTVYDLTA